MRNSIEYLISLFLEVQVARTPYFVPNLVIKLSNIDRMIIRIVVDYKFEVFVRL